MIDFELSEEQEIIRSTIRDLTRDVLAPHARRNDGDGTLSGSVLEALSAAGIVQSQVEPDATSPVTNAIVLEELAVGDVSAALLVGCASAFVQAVADQGSERQKALIQQGIGGGDCFDIGTIALMEPTFSADPLRPGTRAVAVDDGFVLNGRKTMVPWANRCKHLLVVAEHNGAPGAFLVERSTPGVSIARIGSLGLRGLELCEVTLENVSVGADMLLGGDNGADIQRLVDGSNAGVAAVMAGLGRAVMDHIIPYTKERIVHGSPLAQKQKVAFDIADMRIETDAMRWLTWKAAWAIGAGQDGTRLAQLARTYAAERVMQIADNGLQSMGGHGFVEEHPMEMWYRNARSLSLLDGVAGV